MTANTQHWDAWMKNEKQNVIFNIYFHFVQEEMLMLGRHVKVSHKHIWFEFLKSRRDNVLKNMGSVLILQFYVDINQLGSSSFPASSGTAISLRNRQFNFISNEIITMFAANFTFHSWVKIKAKSNNCCYQAIRGFSDDLDFLSLDETKDLRGVHTIQYRNVVVR